MTSQAFDETMVAVTAAEMRRSLGLMPWPAFEAQAEGHRQRYLMAGGFPSAWAPGRGTGRTTRDALAALARCRVLGLSAIHVTGDRSAVRQVKALVKTLGLGIDVFDGDSDRSRGRGLTLLYVDHHEAAQPRR